MIFKKDPDGISGWLIRKEGDLLSALAYAVEGRGVICEIGAWKGKSTVYLGLGSKKNTCTHVYSIDHFRGSPEQGLNNWVFPEYWFNICEYKLQDIVRPLVLPAELAVNVWCDPIELLFIDGDHSYRACKQNLEDYYPYVVKGGVVALHDSVSLNKPGEWCGPMHVANQYLHNNKLFKDVRVCGQITHGVKK